MDELSGRRLVEMLPRLRRFAFGMCGNLHDADDLVQASCQRAIAKFAHWRRGTSLEGWMFAIVRNAYLDLYRGRKVRAEFASETIATAERTVDGERVAENGVMTARLVAMLAGMAADQRSALLLALVEGLTYEEVAEIQGVPVGTVTSRIGRARQQLRQALAGDEMGPEELEGAGSRVSNHQ